MPTFGELISFDGGCSTGDIVEYRWWFDFQLGSPGQTPDITSTADTTSWTYQTSGSRYVKLLVVSVAGDTASYLDWLDIAGP